jgi:pimeloyl-ACP methyl ester carboxylesterase
MRIHLNDTTLYFDVVGPQLEPVGEQMVERPTVILLHGGPGFDHSHFRPALDRFSEQAQLILLDHRGQGRSDTGGPEQWTLATWADDVAAFCAALQIKKPILLGASFGGFVALAAATRHPELAGGLVLLSTAAHIQIDRVIARFGELGGPDAAAAARGLFTTPDDPATMERFTQTCFPLYARRGFNPMIAARAVFTPQVSAHFFRPGGEYGRFDYRPALADLRVPTLILHGALDPIVPVEFARQTAAAFAPGLAELVVFDDCAHDIERDQWDAAAPLIARFLATSAPPR